MHGPATDVFVSYKAEDRSRIAPLVNALEHEGFTVWWDAHIGGGTNWQEDIEQHLDAAKCVIVAWTKRSVGPAGQFVRDEARRANRRHAYLPICLDAVEPPLGFGEIQALSLKGWRGDTTDPRFSALAAAVRSHLSGEYIATHPHVNFREPRFSRRTAIAGGTGVAVAAAAGSWFLLKPTPVAAKRIAILPFKNLSGDASQDYFAEGLSDELRGALSRVGLEVIGSASSSAVKDLDAKAAAAKLGVANILVGSVRRSPQLVRIAAALVSGADGVDRWSQSYDRSPADAIEIQTDIASNVASALSVTLGAAQKKALKLGGTNDPVAQDLRHRIQPLLDSPSPEGYRQAITLMDAAIARDPNYSDAYFQKAAILTSLGTRYPTSAADVAIKLDQAEAVIRQALAITPSGGWLYSSLALVQMFRLDFAASVESAQKAIALSPRDVDVVYDASNYATWFGDPRKALAFADRFGKLEPLSDRRYAQRASALMALRQYPAMMAEYRKAQQLAPKNTGYSNNVGLSLLMMNRFKEAEVELSKVPTDDIIRQINEALLAARTHDRIGAERIVAKLRDQIGDAASYNYAGIYAQLGDRNKAFEQLDVALGAKDPGLVTIRVDPILDPIRSDPRYAAFFKRLKFPTWN